jgi:kynurenine formamidase
MPERPAYRQLPVRFDRGAYRDAWGFYPAEDNLGSLGELTPAARLRGVEAITTGEVVNVTLPLNLPDPPLFGRQRYSHTIFAPSSRNLDDRLDSFYPQASTQWDGFRHVRAREAGFFTGHQGDFEPGDERLGIEHFATQGIIGRGVLVDLADLFEERIAADGGPASYVFGADDLRAAMQRAGTQVLPGDVLCLRTGWMRRYLGADRAERERQAEIRQWPGLAGSEQMAELLWDWRVAAVTADNPAVEWGPGTVDQGSLHRRLVPLLGIPFGELFTFERLAEACRAHERSVFLFVSVPLNLPGGVGSPGNAVAIL